MYARDHRIVRIMLPVEQHVCRPIGFVIRHFCNNLLSLPEWYLQRSGSKEDMVNNPYFCSYLRRLDWHSLNPRPDLGRSLSNCQHKIPILESDDVPIARIPFEFDIRDKATNSVTHSRSENRGDMKVDTLANTQSLCRFPCELYNLRLVARFPRSITIALPPRTFTFFSRATVAAKAPAREKTVLEVIQPSVLLMNRIQCFLVLLMPTAVVDLLCQLTYLL